MDERLARELQAQHLEILQNNNWEETAESLEITNRFNTMPINIIGECMECGCKAKITCQYH
jgi:hypothetical protein